MPTEAKKTSHKLLGFLNILYVNEAQGTLWKRGRKDWETFSKEDWDGAVSSGHSRTSACDSWDCRKQNQLTFRQDAGAHQPLPGWGIVQWWLLREGGSNFFRGMPSDRLTMFQWVNMIKIHYIHIWNPQRINRKIFLFPNDQVSPVGTDFKALGYRVHHWCGRSVGIRVTWATQHCTTAVGGKLYVLR